MNVALVALSVRGAMGQYLEALSSALATHVNLFLFVPEHFEGCVGNIRVYRFRTGRTHRQAMLSLVNPRGARGVWDQVLGTRPAVVHLFNGEGYPWSLLWASWARRAGLPLLVTVHDPEPHPGNVLETFNALLRRFTLRRCAGMHVHAVCFVEKVLEHGLERSRVCVIPHGSLAGRFLRHRKEGVGREPLVLYFGRIEAYKGIDLLVEAGLRLRGKVRIAIAGPGRFPLSLRQRVERHPEWFELHNRYLEDAEVAYLFQRASVCVLPYRQATQSSVPLISAAFGVPVVATAVGAFIEDVPRVGGLLVPPGDPVALAEGVLAALGREPVYPRELEFSSLAARFLAWYKSYV